MLHAAEVVGDVPVGRNLAGHALAALHVLRLRRLLSDAQLADVGAREAAESRAAHGGDGLAGSRAADLVAEDAASTAPTTAPGTLMLDCGWTAWPGSTSIAARVSRPRPVRT